MKSVTARLREISLTKIARVRLALVPAALVLAAPAVWGQNASEPLLDFGLLGQLSSQITVANADNVAPVACAPTSTANGLTFLDNYYGPSIFTLNPDNYTAVNSLATSMSTAYDATTKKGGTTDPNMVAGVTSYMSATGANPAPKVSVQNALWTGVTTTAAQDAGALAHLLSAHDGIEALITWGSFNGPAGAFNGTGGHAVTLDAVNFNATTGVGTVGFVDPWGAGLPISASPSASYVTADVISKGGFLYITNYSENFVPPPQTEGGIPGDFAGNTATSGIIDGFVAESVPDVESTWLILGACAAGVATLRRSLRC
jgi:hypothetical protein